MPKIIRILRSCSMRIFCKFPTIIISKHHFWLVLCIAKNFIWTTLYLSQILSNPNKPCINGKLIYPAFRSFINLNFKKLTLMTGLWSRVTNMSIKAHRPCYCALTCDIKQCLFTCSGPWKQIRHWGVLMPLPVLLVRLTASRPACSLGSLSSNARLLGLGSLP